MTCAKIWKVLISPKRISLFLSMLLKSLLWWWMPLKNYKSLAPTKNMCKSPIYYLLFNNFPIISKNTNKFHKSNNFTNTKTKWLNNCIFKSCRIMKHMKMELQFSINPIWQLLLGLYKSLETNILENSFKNLLNLSFSSIKNNMELLKMPYFKILKEGMDLSKEKWKISTENIKPSYQKNGVWTVSSFINSAPLQDCILLKPSKELTILWMLLF